MLPRSLAPLVVLGLLTACGDDDGTAAASGGGGAASASTSSSTGTSTTTGEGGSGGATGPGGGGGGGATASTGGGGSGGGLAGSVEDDYCAPLAALICERAAACGCGTILPGGTLDVALCEEVERDACMAAYAPIVDAVAAGDARVLADEAAACIALLDASTPGCEEPRGSVTLGLCPAWTTSDVALGDPCDLPICAGGAGWCAEGTCAARPTEGEACQGLECAPGLLCFDTCIAPRAEGEECVIDAMCDPPLRCVEGGCTTLAGPDEPCASPDACALGLDCVDATCVAAAANPCASDADCGNLTFCATPRACASGGGEGAPCVADDGCLEGFGCDLETSACTAHPGDGEPCTNNVLCGPGLACDGDGGTCRPIPGDGEPCGYGPMGPSACAAGLGCVDGTCGALPAEGEACTTDNRCAEGLGCAFEAEGSFCRTPAGEGSACQNDPTCAADLHCGPADVCVPDRPTGAPCSGGNECGPDDACMPDAGGAFVCTPRPGDGERCIFDCDPGLACLPVPADAVCLAEVCLSL